MRGLVWWWAGWTPGKCWELIPYASVAISKTEFSAGIYWLKGGMYIEYRRITL